MQLPKELIALGAKPADKNAAIAEAAKLLSDHGKIAEAYLQGMLARESQENTYLGHGVAIPHGIPAAHHLIYETAISILQIPDGVAWGENGEKAYLVIAIAAAGDEHLQTLRRLTRVLNDAGKRERLKNTNDVAEIQRLLVDNEAEQTTVKKEENEDVTGKAQMAVTLPNALGLHARPATYLVKIARTLEKPVFLRTETDERADTRNLMELLSLGLTQGSHVVIESESYAAAEKIAQAITAGFGDEDELDIVPDAETFDLEPAPAEEKTPPSTGKRLVKPVQKPKKAAPVIKAPLWSPEGEIETLSGAPASEGLACGTVCHYEQYGGYKIGELSREPMIEAAALDWALSEAARGIFITMDNLSRRLSPAKAAIFNAHLAILNDETILNDTIARIGKGENAARAYKSVLDDRIAVFETQPSATLAARSADLRDVRERVLKILLGIEEKTPKFPPNAILCAQHLTPGNIARLPAGEVLGIITATGTANDHNSIIARGMGLPAIVGIGEENLARLADGDLVIFDGNTGKVFLKPTAEQYESAQAQKEKISSWREQALISRMQPGHTQDGKRIEILANINHADVACAALDTGAEGVGLMRTESIFLKAWNLPSEDEHFEHYSTMAKMLADRPLNIRLVDLGGKIKPNYLDFSTLENELLPSRGLSLTLANPEWIIPQMRAICRVARECANVKVMFPMVTTVEDFLAGKALFESVRAEIDCPEVPFGALIETPSAALMAQQLAQHADFLSIGTNDLSRYTLVNGENEDPLHPAVLQLIDWVVRAAKRANKPVNLCGQAAGDVIAAKIFVGLGLESLSIRPPQIATIKQALREANSADLVANAHQALSLSDAQAVRALFTN